MKNFGLTQDLAQRTKTFAIGIIRLAWQLPKTQESRVIAQQIVKSGTSVGANYRAVCRARSLAEFVAKLGTVVEEADETVFWLEILIEFGHFPRKQDNGSARRSQRASCNFLGIQANSKVR